MNDTATTATPILKWLRIAAHGNFHDVPRTIVALDRDFVFWYFDCPFDESLDDYGPDYAIYRIGTDSRLAKRALSLENIEDVVPPDAFVGRVPVENVEFDPTRRDQLFMHKQRFVSPPPMACGIA